MARTTKLVRWPLLALAASLLFAGCDSDTGYFVSGDSEGVEDADVVEPMGADVGPGMDDAFEPAADTEPGLEDGVEAMDVIEDLGADAGTDASPDGAVDVSPVEDAPGLPDLVEPITCAPTQQDAKGPYFIEGAPFDDSIAGPDEPGDPLLIKGFILTEDCDSISEVVIDVWQTDAEGLYPGEEEGFRLRGKVIPSADGRYAFTTVLPGFYEGRPRHLHLKVAAPGYVELVTQLYFEGDPYLWPVDSCGPPTCHSDDPARILALTELGAGDEVILVGDFDIVLAISE